MAIPTYKMIICGSENIGKTLSIKKNIVGNRFDPNRERYAPTLGVEVHPLTFCTTNEERIRSGKHHICFNAWDCAGQDRFMGLRDGYYVMAGGAIVVVWEGEEQKADEYVEKLVEVIGEVKRNNIVVHYVNANNYFTMNDLNNAFVASNVSPYEFEH